MMNNNSPLQRDGGDEFGRGFTCCSSVVDIIQSIENDLSLHAGE